jgi:Helix-turn-helix domain of resolvase
MVQSMLGESAGISAIAKATGLTRQTIYRIRGVGRFAPPERDRRGILDGMVGSPFRRSGIADGDARE